MAYDAEIRVGTKIDTSQMRKLQLQIEKATDKTAKFAAKLDELKNKKIPTKEYEELQVILEGAKYKAEQLAEAIKNTPKTDIDEEMKKLAEQEGKVYERMKLIHTELSKPVPERKSGLYEELQEAKNELYVIKNAETALSSGHSYADSLTEDYEKAQKAVENVEKEIEALKQSDKAFTPDIDTEKIAEAEKELSYAQAELQALNKKQDELIAKQKNHSDGFKNLTNSAKKAYAALSGGAKSAFGKVSSVAKKAFGAINRDAKKTNGLLATMRSRMSGLALSLLIFNQVTKAFNAMVSSAKEGISEFARYSKDCNAVLSEFKSSLQTVKYSLGAAFAPIIQAVVPYLTMLTDALNSAISKISQFFAVLSGSSTYHRAIKQQVDFAGSLEDTANAAKEAAGALAGFDKLNVVKQQENTGSSGGSAGAGGAEFEEVPVDSGIKELAQKVKEIFAELFAPMKEAWDREGQFVIDSWKSALDEIWKLVKDIGRDFLIVWNQEETIRVFEDILHIIGDIGLSTSNLARNFKEAWNENQTGLHLLEGIRDIIGVIVGNLRDAADYTVTWSDELNFSPLMQKTNEWIQSLIPAMDSLSGVLSDFYTLVLLPLAGWAVEEGLPDLLQVFIDFNNKVDWEDLREELATFWGYLEKFGETVGEGLIIFIGDLSEKIANFTKSETFKKMLEWLEEMMDSTTPEDIANGIETIAKAFIFFKIASLGLGALKTIAPAVSTVKAFVDIFKGGKGTAVAKEMTTVSSAAGALYSTLGALSTIGIITATVVVGIEFSKDYKEWKANIEKYGWDEGRKKTAEENNANPYNKESNYSKNIENWNQKFSEFKNSVMEFASFNIWTDTEWGKSFSGLESGLDKASVALNSAAYAATGFQQSLDNTKYSAEGLAKGAATSGVAAGTALVEGLKSSTSDVGSVVSTVGANIASKTPEVEGKTSALGIAAGGALISSLKSSTSDAVSSVVAIGTQLATQAPVMSKQTNLLGAAAVAGFNIGIANNTGETDTTVQDWMKGTEKAIHDSAMRFGSPSKTAEDFGLNTVLGYNNGVSRNVSRTVSVIRYYMQTIQNTFKDIVVIMSDIGQRSISAFIDGLASKQNELKKTVDDMTKTIESAIAASSKLKFSSGYSVSPKQKQGNIPMLASGSVIRGGNPFLAILGDQPAGQTNVEAPLSTIKQAVKDALRENGGMGGGEFTFVAQLNGKNIYEETVRQDQMFKKSTGKSRLGN